MSAIEAELEGVYEAMEGSEASMVYSARHGIVSASVLTVTDEETAGPIAERLAPRIEGKTVVEIGGGIGLLALHMGLYAKRVYCIEANPMWTSVFVASLLHVKPKNVSFLFGSADEFAGTLRGDVAIFCTHSGIDAMRATAAMFAPVVVDVYGEMIADHPEAFDPVARELRGKVFPYGT